MMTTILAVAPELDWPSMATNLSFGAFVMWFAWHTQTHTIPALLKAHEADRVQTRADYLKVISDSRQEFVKALNDTITAQNMLTLAITSLSNQLGRHDTDMKVAHAIELQQKEELGKVAGKQT